MTSATTNDIPGLSGVVGAQPDAFAGQATPSSTAAKAFIARSGWLAGEGRRLDAAAYSSGGLAARDRIITGQHPWQRLDQVAHIFSEARFTRTYITDPKRSAPYLNGSDMLLADLQGLLRLSIKNTPQLAKLLLQPDWTLMSCSGTIGRTVFVREEMRGMAGSHDLIRISPYPATAEPGYLFAFLTSIPAQAMIRQRTYGSVIQHIEPHHIADLPVPLPDRAMQERIHGLVAGAARARTEAACLLDEAAAYFDGLAGPMPSVHDHARAVGLVRRSELGLRLDAFHHVGYSAEGRLRGEPFGAIAKVFVPGRMKLIHADKGAAFYTGVDIYQNRPTPTKWIARWLPGFKELEVEAGAVLMQVDGQRYGLMGRPVYAGSSLQGAAVSWHMARIQTTQAARIYAFARSEAGRRAIVRQSFGTSVPSITAQLLAQVEVPTLPDDLTNKAKRALELREQADADEEQAIREVEAWLNS